jgi:hypothetical protein
MSGKHGRTSEPPPNSKYGSDGDEVHSDATRLLNNLLAPKAALTFGRSGTPRWDAADGHGFGDYVALDSGVAFLEPGPEVDGGDLGDLFRNFGQLNASLPFSEGERRWLIAAQRANWRERYRERTDFAEDILAVETTVISAGLQQVLYGRDLVRRWAAWRREEHEFKGQGSLENAQVLLGSIIRELVPAGLDDGDARDLPYAAAFLV